ncbi:MAG: hypothetical protein KGI60_02610, partial [Patescibacteria group bacterium]|nr:hypothetical protein [Patescibacteria group bacterium]
GNDKRLLEELDSIRQAHGLEKLYLVYMNESRVLMGVRLRGKPVDGYTLARSFLFLLQGHAAIDQRMVQKLDFNILTTPGAEVVEVLLIEAIPLMRKKGVDLSLVSADEESGRVVVEFRGKWHGWEAMHCGIERTLKSMLPWVRSVESNTVRIAESAVLRIVGLMDESRAQKSGGLRVSLIRGGCCGWKYDAAIVDGPRDGDYVIECKRVINGRSCRARVFIDLGTYSRLEGGEIAYQEARKDFVFTTPKAYSSCQCGKSVDF